MAIMNKPDMSYGTWAENGNIEIPSSEKVNEGWAIEKPLNEHMNWVQNRQDRMLQYLNQYGIAEWDFRTEYPKDGYVARGGELYQALSQNKDADPTLNPDIWIIPFASNKGLGSSAEEIKKIKEVAGYLKHYVLIDKPVMKSIAKGVGYGNADATANYGFVGDVPTILRKSKVVAAFSGGTEVNDVVTHGQLKAKLQGYLVDDVYITTSNEDPKDRFGYGTWERFAQGEVLVGFSTSVSNETPQWVKTAGSRFGEYDHTLVTEETPKHKHPVTVFHEYDREQYPDAEGYFSTNGVAKSFDIRTHSADEPDNSKMMGDGSGNSLGSIGGDKPHNNVQPSLVVYMWKRVA